MSKPNDVSQEAWDAADVVGEAIHGRHERGWVCWPLVSHDGRPAQEIVARAILAATAEEREGCAVVADKEEAERLANSRAAQAGSGEWGPSDNAALAQAHKALTARSIAFSIRARTP